MAKTQKIILITGAGAGLGKALSLELAARGHKVYAGVRDMKRAHKDYKPLPEGISLIELDVNKVSHVKRSIKKIIKENGHLDVLVNNAGFGMYGAFEELSDKEFRLQMETNFFAVLALVREVLPHFRKAESGRIVNIGSILGLQGLPTGTAYVSSKFALEGFSESLHYELLPFGVSVVLVEPGLIRTNFKKNMKRSSAVSDFQSPYAFLNAALREESESYRGMSLSAESAARKVASIIEKRRPRLRYRVGTDSHLVYLLRRMLPQCFLDFFVGWYLKRRKKNFLCLPSASEKNSVAQKGR